MLPRPLGPLFAAPSSPLLGQPLGMDLNGFLLDEEGAFSLSGFQEFTVRPYCGAPGRISRGVSRSLPALGSSLSRSPGWEPL